MIRSIRRLGIATVLAVFAGLAPAATGAAAADTVPVQFTIHAALTDGKVRLTGTATVPDGAWIIYVVYRADAPLTRSRNFARVEDGRYAAAVDVSAWPPGKIAIDAHFQILLPGRKQPDAVVARYGPNGERMVGPTVVKGGEGFRAAVVSTSVIKKAK
jgi:hypothetical protein